MYEIIKDVAKFFGFKRRYYVSWLCRVNNGIAFGNAMMTVIPWIDDDSIPAIQKYAKESIKGAIETPIIISIIRTGNKS
jgi:hypothetical protein